MTTLLIDGDTLAYVAALTSEKVVEDFDGGVVQRYANMEEAAEKADLEIERIRDSLAKWKPTSVKIALTGPTNFRKAILPTYKSKRGEKPMALGAVRKHLIDRHGAVIKEGLEADDIIGIWATHPKLIPGDKIVVSVDKDLRSIPGMLWDTKAPSPEEIEEVEASRWHMRQTLTGDTTDGYAGCPGVGPVSADKMLSGEPEEWWPAVLAAYAKKGLTEADALVQARVARILRAADYNFKTREPILWQPPKT